MPFYEYQCSDCSEIFEIFVRNGEKVPDLCEICGGKLHKIISVSSFQLKGSGWYVTDYARKSTKPSTDTNNKSSEISESNNSSKDTKTGSPTLTTQAPKLRETSKHPN
ncbi:MAG: zinc ribbon domain-containing protein [Deltaproteobacteria bacterium]|nr:zinc ribbon domain-containing protein [Deltaproteobacteria bacterium]